MDKNLMDMATVAKTFGLSVRTMRDYKRLGIIEPVKRIKNKDYYSRKEILKAQKTVEKESTRSSIEIAELVKKDRKNIRKSNRY